MNNFVQQGKRLTFVNGTSVAIDSGAVVLITDRISIAVADIAADGSGEVQTEGVFTIAKTAGEAWTLGDQLYWDASASSVTTTSSSHKKAGIAAAIADSADTTGPVKINV